MEIHSILTNRSGSVLPVVYRDATSVHSLGARRVSGVHAYCFCEDKLVIVYAKEQGYWTPPGGGVEPGESVEEAVVREVLEETNMHVTAHRLIGYQDISEPQGVVTQTRSVCLVTPLGPFVADADPDGDVTEIRLIDPAHIKQYFDWGVIGEHVLAQAITLKNSF